MVQKTIQYSNVTISDVTHRFFNSYGNSFSLSEVIDEIRNYMNDNDYNYNLIIGSDSQRYDGHISFVTAIIIQKVGKGGRFFYFKNAVHHPMSLQYRLLTEATYSVEILEKIKISDIYLDLHNIEVHVDVSENGKSRSFIKECMSYIRGLGYDCKIKPDGYGASKVADRYT
ncbi:ribonuclease H-like YkuK family protein [Candidatus Margulisiibacteriota bacterium]